MADELSLKDALGMFSQGMQQYGLSKAIAQAQDQVQSIRMAGLKETEQRQALGKIAQGLTMQMAGMGANAATLEQVAKNIMPQTPSTLDQLEVQAIQDNNPELLKRLGQAEYQRGQRQMAGMEAKLKVQEVMFKRQQEKEINKQMISELSKKQATFKKTSTDLDKAITQARNAQSLLTTKGPASDLAVSALGTMIARASSEVGNLTEMERSAFEGRQDIASVLKRKWTKTMFSQLTEGDRKALLDLVNLYSNNAEALKQGNAEVLAGQYAQLFPDRVTPEQAMTKITGGKFKPAAAAAAPQIPGPVGSYFKPYK